MLTHFYPATHGFHFSNLHVPWTYGMAHGTQLCGGMTFAALDYYYARIAIPATTTAPAEGSPLQRYIHGRQMHAHRYAMPLLAVGRNRWGPNDVDTCRRGGAFTALRQLLDTQRPVPLLLGAIGRPLSTGSHWVLAIGYDTFRGECSRVHVYDNNYPDETCMLEVNMLHRRIDHMRRRRPYAFYVPYPDYRPWPPDRPLGDVSLGEMSSNPLGLDMGSIEL